jgi:cytochrome c oxidase assembly factor CtaG
VDPIAEAILLSWNFDPWLAIPLLGGAAVYLRGWLLLRKKLPHRFDAPRLVAFQLGLIVVLLALTSPIDTFAGLLLFVHMTQHILLAMAAPPLLLLGAPMLPLLRGLPRLILARVVGPVLVIAPLRNASAFLVRPIVALTSFSIATIVWHVPFLYDLALRSEFWHQIEHICFFFTGLLFWWPVVQPWPSRPHWSGWAMILYLLAADLVNTAVSAVLCFAERVLYPTYAAAPELWGISALADQAVAGAIMWVAGSLAFLLPVGWILNRLLEPSLVTPPHATGKRRASVSPRHHPDKPTVRPRIFLVPFLIVLSQFIQPPMAGLP